MNFDDRVKTVLQFGYTERQARFLVTVMLHSGVCAAPVRGVRRHRVRPQGQQVL